MGRAPPLIHPYNSRRRTVIGQLLPNTVRRRGTTPNQTETPKLKVRPQ